VSYNFLCVCVWALVFFGAFFFCWCVGFFGFKDCTDARTRTFLWLGIVRTFNRVIHHLQASAIAAPSLPPHFPANSAFTGPSLFPGFETSLNYFIKKKTFETSNARCTLLLW
jgi:hypothetical protein